MIALNLLKKLIGQNNYLSFKYKCVNYISTHLLKLQSSYSQCGEDMILKHLLQDKKMGFYIDVGAYHPVNLSNTYFFYQRGWSGINIDATPGSMRLFEKLRPKDINLETAIADKEMELDYFLFERKELNTLSLQNVQEIEAIWGIKPFATTKILTKSLRQILDQYLPPNKEIDLLSIDAEGFDEIILKSNDWSKYRPSIIAIERHIPFQHISEDSVYCFLLALNYNLEAKVGPTYIFKKS